MIRKIELQLNIPETIQPRFLGSVLHGVLMENLSQDMADFLHQNSAYSPLKQRIYTINHQVIWEVVSMNDYLSEQLVKVFSEENIFYLKHYEASIEVISYKIQGINIQSFIQEYLNNEDLPKFIKLSIITPMSYKSNGVYAIFPNVQMFFRSIMLQFDSFFSEYRMYDKETLDFIGNNVHIIDYRLRSTRFHIEKVKIPSFIGEITLKVNGPNTFFKLIHCLLAFGELSGSGIKTSLGMGKYMIQKYEHKHLKK